MHLPGNDINLVSLFPPFQELAVPENRELVLKLCWLEFELLEKLKAGRPPLRPDVLTDLTL